MRVALITEVFFDDPEGYQLTRMLIEAAGRGAAGDDHVVGNVGLAAQVDDLDVVGLVVVEGFLDEGQDLRRCRPRRGLTLTCYDEISAFKLRLLYRAGCAGPLGFRWRLPSHPPAANVSPPPGGA